jgi:hypothetical protein
MASLFQAATPILAAVGEPGRVSSTLALRHRPASLIYAPRSAMIDPRRSAPDASQQTTLIQPMTAVSGQATPVQRDENPRPSRIVGMGCEEGHQRNMDNIRELCQNIIRIRENFFFIGTSLDMLDDTGPLSPQTARDSPESVGNKWRRIADVS